MNKKALLLIPFFSLLLAGCGGDINPSGGSYPTSDPSSTSTSAPTSDPTSDPTGTTTGDPTSDPTSGPTSTPTSSPTSDPTSTPTGASSGGQITSDPTTAPTSQPTSTPTSSPSGGASSGHTAPTSTPTSAPTSSSTSAPEPTYTVTWKNYDGSDLEVDTNVPKGTMPTYDGEEDPVRPGDASAPKYMFTGWDKVPMEVTSDVTYVAQYEAYAFYQLVDDFEDYEVANELKDEGWFVTTSTASGWSTETSANLSLSSNSIEGTQALRFNSYRNTVGFKINKTIEDNTFDELTNAVEFTLMTPANPIKATLLLNIPFDHPIQGPIIATLKHPIPVTSGEYVDYIIPFDDNGWLLWEDQIDLQEAADYLGITRDRLASMLSGFEIYLQYDNCSPSDYAAFLDKFQFTTVDDQEVVTSEDLQYYSRYTGTTVEGNTLRVDIAYNGDAVARVIDSETPLEIEGHVDVDYATREMVFSSNAEGVLTYTGKMINRGQKINFVSATGSAAASVAEMNLDAVQVLEDFEEYTESGTAYYQGNTNKNNRSGLRGAYYSEMYTGSGSADWGGGGWELLDGEGNQMNLIQDGYAHAGDQYLSLHRDQSRAHRYMQWEVFDGTSDIHSYRGSTFSFWAKTSGVVKTVTVYALSISAPTASNYKNGGNSKSGTFVPETLDEWTHYSFELNPNIVYYGFIILVEKDYDHSAAQLFIDDIEIYTADPYAEYIPPVAVTGVSISSESLTMVTGETSTLVATVEPEDATNKNVIWTSNDNTIATVENGVVTAVAPGTASIIVETEDGGFSKTCEVTVNAPLNYPTGTYKGTASVDGISRGFVIALGNEDNGLVAVMIANHDVVATSIEYNSSTHEFTIHTTGEYSEVLVGDITGTYDKNENKLINVSCLGDIADSIENNGEISVPKAGVYDCDGTTEELQQIFKRRYGSPWTVDETNSDRITSNTTEFVSGTSSVKRRGWTGGRVALNFMNDFNPVKSVQSVQFWVYNPSSNDVSLDMYYYQATGLNDYGSAGTVVAKANQWTYVASWFGTKNIYNFQITDVYNTGVYLSFDNITFF